MSGHFDDFAPVMVTPPSTLTHRCHFTEDRHVVCTCGWRSPSVGADGAQESFDHIFDAIR